MEKQEHLVTIYTYQHKNTLKELDTVGYLTGNHDFSLAKEFGNSFQESYDWMRKQLSEMIPEFTGDYPMWAWLDKQGDQPLEKDTIEIIAQVPLKKVVLSDFDLWHVPLNSGFFTEDVGLYDKWLKDEVVISDLKKKKSWSTIFDLTYNAHQKEFNDYYGIDPKGRRIQACVDRIYMEEISKINFIS